MRRNPCHFQIILQSAARAKGVFGSGKLDGLLLGVWRWLSQGVGFAEIGPIVISIRVYSVRLNPDYA